MDEKLLRIFLDGIKLMAKLLKKELSWGADKMKKRMLQLLMNIAIVIIETILDWRVALW